MPVSNNVSLKMISKSQQPSSEKELLCFWGALKGHMCRQLLVWFVRRKTVPRKPGDSQTQLWLMAHSKGLCCCILAYHYSKCYTGGGIRHGHECLKQLLRARKVSSPTVAIRVQQPLLPPHHPSKFLAMDCGCKMFQKPIARGIFPLGEARQASRACKYAAGCLAQSCHHATGFRAAPPALRLCLSIQPWTQSFLSSKASQVNISVLEK